MAGKVVSIHGEPSFRLRSGDVELFITKRGGQMAPVRFRVAEEEWVSPYSLAPWEPKDTSNEPPILQILRGDFFCLPFGENKELPHVHGDPANLEWKCLEQEKLYLHMEMEMSYPSGKIEKKIHLNPGELAVYQEHVLSGFQGRFNFGNHPIIEFPQTGGPYHIATSPFRYGSVKPHDFNNPPIGDYGCLKTGGKFSSFSKVPLAAGGYTNLHEFPAREGFEDLVMISSKPGDLAWTAVTLNGYIWLQLKDPSVLPSTLFWFSHGGRHQAPWNGKHRYRVGMEEVCSHFSDGLELSRKDLLKKHEVPTSRYFSRSKPFSVKIIQCVHPIPTKFGQVQSVQPSKDLRFALVKNYEDVVVKVPLDLRFLLNG